MAVTSSISPFPKQQILDPSKFKEFADDNIRFDENGRKFSKPVENTVGTGEIAPFPAVFSKDVHCRCVWERDNSHISKSIFHIILLSDLNKLLMLTEVI